MGRARRRTRMWPRLAAASMALGAVTAWLMIWQDGVSNARMIGAVAATVGAVMMVVGARKEGRRGTEREV